MAGYLCPLGLHMAHWNTCPACGSKVLRFPLLALDWDSLPKKLRCPTCDTQLLLNGPLKFYQLVLPVFLGAILWFFTRQQVWWQAGFILFAAIGVYNFLNMRLISEIESS